MADVASPVGHADYGRNSAGSERNATTPAFSHGGRQPNIRSAGVRRWKKMHEQNVMMQLSHMREEKKVKAKISIENARNIARKIPVEILAKEWLSGSQATVDLRVYLVDKVLPTLILGLEKLLTEADAKGLVTDQAGGGYDPDFNPINFLAQYLMRNNPRYSNFSEASPYIRGLRQVTEELKTQLFEMEDNRLARIKAEAKRKRANREELARIRQRVREQRQEILMSQFTEWSAPTENNMVELSLLQNALRSFVEVVEQFPPELQQSAQYGHSLEPTDEAGHTLSQKEFVQYLTMYVETLSFEMFELFMAHMAECAKAYCTAAEREERRITLTNLFICCDHSGIGLLDRHRILSLFEQFWDVYIDSTNSMRNPRKWPVVEVDEADDSISGEDDEKLRARRLQEQLASEKTDLVSGEEELPEESQSKEGNIQLDEDTDEKVEVQGEAQEAEDGAKAEPSEDKDNVIKITDEEKDAEAPDETEAEAEQDAGEDEGNADGSEPAVIELPIGAEEAAGSTSNLTERASVTFAEGTAFEREITGLSITRSQSQTSAFDEDNLNVSQFVQLTETFLGENPDKVAFEKLVIFIRGGYEETEDEKIQRLIRARKEALSTNRKLFLNALFEKWDNDGSGYLDLDEVVEVMVKYKEGQEREAIARAREELKEQSKYHDDRLNKKEFHTFVNLVVGQIPGADSFEYFVEFLANSVERSYAERVRGEARKKWLKQILTAAQTSSINLEPVYKAVFQALYRDAEAHGGEKRISANIALLERNTSQPDRGDVVLRYTACTPEDASYVLNKILYNDMKGVSFAAVESGQPVHVPRVNTHGNIYFWNTDRSPDEREGSFIVVPLKDRKKRVFGVLGIDTLSDPHTKAIFITHEIQFFQGVAQTFSTAYHLIELRRKLLRITESAISWIKRRVPHVVEIVVYLVEPSKSRDFVLRRVMTTDEKGFPVHLKDPAIRLERKDNLFRDYLFKCVDNSETVSADAYGHRRLAFPLRNDEGKAVAVVDLSLGALCKLPAHENKEAQRMLRLLQQAHRELTREFAGEERLQVLDAEKDEEIRTEIMFDRLMLMELRENVAKLDSQAYAELKAYKNPPEIVLHILRATLAIFYTQQALEGEFDDWNTIRMHINSDLIQKIQDYDPTSSEDLISPGIIEYFLKAVPHGEVAKHSSLPAQYLYNWLFACLSLIEHTWKMRQNSDKGALAGSSSDRLPPGAADGEEGHKEEEQEQRGEGWEHEKEEGHEDEQEEGKAVEVDQEPNEDA